MRIRHYRMIGFLLMTFALLASSALAAEQKFALAAGPDGKGSRGEAVIKDKGPDQKEITIHATGLKPNAVYTVWLVNMKPKMDMMGVGTGDYSFKSDDKGIGHYVATVSTGELKKWKMLEVAYHPDKNPTNMMNMKIALKSDLK